MPRGRRPTFTVAVTFSDWESMTVTVLSFSLVTKTVYARTGVASPISVATATIEQARTDVLFLGIGGP
jgi:hypothetical protein